MNDSYYSVFKQRMTADGFSYKEQIQNIARKNFAAYLNETPTSETVKVGDFYYKVAIVENKQDEFRLSKQMLSAIDNYFPIGSLVLWEKFKPADSPENYWLLWKQQQNSIEDYYVNYISRCNHKLKWVDENGVRYEQYVYEFSSKESMIRATFKSRVQEIIASEPNKFMEIIMPYTDKIKREQRFIVDGEAWYVIEFDSSSVSGITYITLGEDKKDFFNDSLIERGNDEDLANAVDENKNKIMVMDAEPVVEYSTNYVIKPTYYEDGAYRPNTRFIFVIDEKKYTGIDYEQIFEEETKIEVQLEQNPDIKAFITVHVNPEPQPLPTLRINGNESIRWGKMAAYEVESELNGIIERISDADFVINDDELATLEIEDGICYVKANSKRKTGTITLTATIPFTSSLSEDVRIISKDIDIISLW